MPTLTLTLLPETLAICRLKPDEPMPDWALQPGFYSLTRTADELSIVCAQARVPEDVQSDDGWRALKVEGPLDLSLVGILASLTSPLASAGVNIFAISTYDTDYLLVKQDLLEDGVRALEEVGFEVKRDA
jgi:hypothetical protein